MAAQPCQMETTNLYLLLRSSSGQHPHPSLCLRPLQAYPLDLPLLRLATEVLKALFPQGSTHLNNKVFHLLLALAHLRDLGRVLHQGCLPDFSIKAGVGERRGIIHC